MRSLLVALALLSPACTTNAAPPVPVCDWKAGIAAAAITPRQSMWMAGYAARKKPSEGTVQELYAKALALEDSGGRRVVFVTMDIIGVLTTLRESVETRAAAQFKLPAEALLMAASHTHCGPEYRTRKGKEQEAGQYHQFLEERLVSLIGEALGRLEPARLGYAHARCGFAMNRRRNYQLAKGDVNETRAPNPDGPVDHDVPVLVVTGAEGALRAAMFGYACHNTTLGFYQFCGDYAGFAQEYLQADRPGLVALFVTGCGADQNPCPRRTLDLAKQHGRSLATAVNAALDAGPRPIHGPVLCAMEKVELDRAGKTPGKFDYPVQVLHFGPELTLVALPSEVVVDYSLRLKRELRQSRAVWVGGYCNGYYGYIASRRIIEEGGYEASGNWAPSIEDRIVAKAQALADRLATAAKPAAAPPKPEAVKPKSP